MTTEQKNEENTVEKFLVVVDGTDEWRLALRYAALRVKGRNRRVALLYVIESEGISPLGAIEDMIRDEKHSEAQQRLQGVAKEAGEISGHMPALFIREGTRVDVMSKLLDEEPSITHLVLAANTGSEGPGPLVSYITGKGSQKLHIPVTIVPGCLTPEEIDQLAQ